MWTSGGTVICGRPSPCGEKSSPFPIFEAGELSLQSALRRFMSLKRSVSLMWNSPSERSSAPVVEIAAYVFLVSSFWSRLSLALNRRQPATTDSSSDCAIVIT